MFKDTVDNDNPIGIVRFSDLYRLHLRRQIETNVYLACHQGIKAGVRLNVHSPLPEEAGGFTAQRVVFIEFPEKTVEWAFVENEENTPWLDSFPQYDQ